MTNLKESLESRKYIQNLVFYSFFLGLLFPLRIILNSILGGNWYGSFGILTVISVSFLFLAEKNKLGWYGRTFLNKFRKIQKGKRRYFIIGQAIFAIIVSSSILLLIDHGNNIHNDFKDQLNQKISTNYQSFDDFKSDAIETAKEKPLEVVFGMFYAVYLIFANPDVMAVIISVENNLSDNLFTHLFTISLLEEIEILGIVLYYQKKLKTHTFI
jgi:hypothetical protein